LLRVRVPSATRGILDSRVPILDLPTKDRQPLRQIGNL
jgi:hypothetical protein